MAFASVAPMASKSEMNVVPLIDVLLVLLIIFMVTVPAVTRAIPLELPNHTPRPAMAEPAPMRLAVGLDGQATLDGRAVAARELHTVLVAAVNLAEVEGSLQPLLRVEVHPDAEYQAMASVLAVARDAGMVRIGMDEGAR